MLYIPKIGDLTDYEVKSAEEKLYSKLNEEQNLRKVAKSLYIFLTTPHEVEKYVQSNCSGNFIHHYNVEILNIFDPEIQLIINANQETNV